MNEDYWYLYEGSRESDYDDRNDQDGRLDSDRNCDSMERACASAAHEQCE